MEIKNKVLLSIRESDLIYGVFFNDQITEVADKCFYNMPTLVKVFLPKVKKIGNDCFRYNDSLTTVTLPVLAQCGNYCFRYNGSLTTVTLPVLAQCGNDCFRYNDSLTTVTLIRKEYNVKNVDGSCFIIEKEKTAKGIKIYTGYNFVSMTNKIVEKQECFVAEKDNFFAHGQTVKKAISDVRFKIVAEKLKNEPIKKDTKLTVKYYRLLTGACDFGCRSWLDANNIPYDIINKGMSNEETVEKEPMKAVKLLPILKKSNAYGLSKFEKLITF